MVLSEIYLNDLFLIRGMVIGLMFYTKKTKQNNNRIHSTTMLTPIQASLKKNEVYVYKIFLNKRKKIKPKYEIGDLVRTADLKKTFSKSNTTNWSYKLYIITEKLNLSIPSYKIDNLSECYNEASLVEKDRVNNERKQRCYEKIKYHLDQIKMPLSITAYRNYFVC